jgi:hypothetical protein
MLAARHNSEDIMNVFDIQDQCNDTEVADDHQFRRFIEQGGNGILCVPSVLLNESETSHFQDTPFREIVTKRPR